MRRGTCWPWSWCRWTRGNHNVVRRQRRSPYRATLLRMAECWTAFDIQRYHVASTGIGVTVFVAAGVDREVAVGRSVGIGHPSIPYFTAWRIIVMSMSLGI